MSVSLLPLLVFPENYWLYLSVGGSPAVSQKVDTTSGLQLSAVGWSSFTWDRSL